jgi:hypothetical protein|tara:strand:- start:689 stop:931 length:243 start_codon:yes stop_codon:yes gene_type:complete
LYTTEWTPHDATIHRSGAPPRSVTHVNFPLVNFAAIPAPCPIRATSSGFSFSSRGAAIFSPARRLNLIGRGKTRVSHAIM